MIVTLKYIEEAISNLGYKNETTLKSKLIQSVRKYYRDENSIETLKSIDTEDLVREIWDTGDKPELIKSKKKNFSSVKSSVNSDLKKLYAEGKNPLGIIIGHGNTFDISEEAKNKTLSGIADIFKEKGIDDSGKITEMLTTLSDMLAGALSSAGGDDANKEISRLKKLVGALSDKLGLNTEEDKPVIEKKPSASDNITVEQTVSSPVSDVIVPESVSVKTFSEITDILKDKDAAAADKTAKIMESVKKMLAEAISSAGSELGSEETEEIKDFFTGLAGDATEEILELPEDEIVEEVDEMAGDELPHLEESIIISEDEVITEVSETIEEIIPEKENKGSTCDESGKEEKEGESLSDDSLCAPPEGLSEDFIVEESAGEETAEALPDDFAITETAVENDLEEIEESELVEDAAAEEFEEVITEEVELDESESVREEGLRIDPETLAELSAAAKALEKIGPDLTSSIYSEEEIKAKAKILSAEFDRYLTFRERFYNQHILIKGGNYHVGGNGIPERTVDLREFYIGKFPVTNALFEIFIEQTGYVTTAEKYGFGMVYIPRMQKTKNILTGTESFIWNNQLQHKKVSGACWYHPNGPESTLYIKRTHPVVQVSLEDACAFAAWTGKRIPSEKEWEAAARTSRGYLYPWGDNWRDDACNLEKSLLGDTSPVDQYIKFSNECEVADTLGNVLEWTLDPWQALNAGEEDEENYVIKGASWISDAPVSLTDRQPFYKNACSNILGFRCIAI